MIPTHNLFKIEEDAAILAGLAGIKLAVAATLVTLSTHRKANQLESKLVQCQDDNYLTLRLESDISANQLFSGLTIRGKLLNRLLRRNELIIVNNIDTARLLKQYLSQYPIFGNLFQNRTIELDVNQFFSQHRDLLRLFGDLRSETSITWDGVVKKFMTLGLSRDVPDELINDCVRANLFYLAILLRQVMLRRDEIQKITLIYKEPQVRH